MRSLTATLAAALILMTTGPASAQPPRSDYEQLLGRRLRPPVVPAGLGPMVREARRDRIVVRGLDGDDILVPLSDVETEALTGHANGRYLGFHFSGYEFFGYRLVDRRMSGEEAVIETGDAPRFAPDGRHFAAAQVSGAAFGNLEGVAIWRVEPDRTVQIFFTDVLPEGEDWRIDGWPRADCVSVSSVERQAAEGESPPPRRHFGIEVGETLRINGSDAFPGCNVTDATAHD